MDFDKSHPMYEEVIESAANFIEVMTVTFGPEEGSAIWEKLGSVINDDVKNEVFMHALTETYSGGGTLSLCLMTTFIDRISVVKALRGATGMSLKESGDVINKLVNGDTVTIKLAKSVSRSKTINRLTELSVIARR